MYNLYRNEFDQIGYLVEKGEFDRETDIMIQSARMLYIRPTNCPKIQQLWLQHEKYVFLDDVKSYVGFNYRISKSTLDCIYKIEDIENWISITRTV